MIHKRLPIEAIALVLALVSCTTFPAEQFSLDISDEIVPVMLSEGRLEPQGQSISYQAGFSSSSTLIFVKDDEEAGRYEGDTKTTESRLNRPIGEQLRDLARTGPSAIYVTKLRFEARLRDNFALSSSTTYFLIADGLVLRGAFDE